MSRGRSAFLLGLTALGALGGCATSSTGSLPPVGALHQSDLPADLPLQQVPLSFSDSQTQRLVDGLNRVSKNCGNSAVALFAPAGRSFVAQNIGSLAQYPEVLSWTSRCTSSAAAEAVYRLTGLSAGQRISGVGDAASLTSLSDSHLQFQLVAWRSQHALGSVIVSGPPTDTAITPALAEELAGRAVSRV